MRDSEQRPAVVPLLGLGALLFAAEPAEGQDRPAAVTAARIQAGTAVFRGAGNCHTCHGIEARGIPNLGSDLTDDRWYHADGSFASILEVIRRGVTAERTASGIPMPPGGGARLSEEQRTAVAAYVWSLSH